MAIRKKRPKPPNRLRRKVQITLDPDLLRQIDEARGGLVNRSRWLELAARRSLET